MAPKTLIISLLLLLGAVPAVAQPWAGNWGGVDTTMATFPNLALWLKGSNDMVKSGDQITDWDDASANDWDATQDTTNKSPNYVASAINGKPGVQFRRDSTEYFNVDEASAIWNGSDKPWAYFVVLKWDGTISTAYEDAISCGNSSADIEAAYEWRKNDNTYSVHTLIKDDVPVTVATSWSHSTFTSQHVYAVRSTGTAITMYTDGTQVATMDHTTVGDVAVNRMKLGAQFYMGALSTTKYATFTLVELVVYTGDVGTGSTQWAWIHNKLKADYATP